MKIVFDAGCPNCHKDFPVDGGLRHAGVNLICPFCQTRFLPDDAHHLDERTL